MLHRHFFQVDIFQAADIDRGRRVAFGIRTFGIGMDAAHWAEAVLDDVLVECMGADVFFGREQLQLVTGCEPQKGTLA